MIYILKKSIWTRNFFEKLQKSGGFTQEIKSRTARNLGRNQRNLKKEILRLMVQRIGAIDHEVRVQKHKCISISNTVKNAFESRNFEGMGGGEEAYTDLRINAMLQY